VQCVDDFVDVSCDFEHPFICGYTKTVTGTFSWEQTDASDLRYMQNNRNGKHTDAVVFIIMFLYMFIIYNSVVFTIRDDLLVCLYDPNTLLNYTTRWIKL